MTTKTYGVCLHPNAARMLLDIDRKTNQRIKQALHRLARNPFTPRSGADIKRLRGTRGRQDLFRLRVGEYRVIYAVDAGVVWITEIYHRSKGYKWLD